MIREWLSVLGVKQHTEETADDVDTKVNIHTLYKHRWVWYHLILTSSSVSSVCCLTPNTLNHSFIIHLSSLHFQFQ